MKHLPRIFFGLKYKRLPAWVRDVWREKPGINELVHMQIMALKALFNPVSKKEYFKRMWICYHCPIFDRKFKSCRNGDLGCGCYIPYKAIAPVDCWVNERNPKKGWGLPGVDFATNFKEIAKNLVK